MAAAANPATVVVVAVAPAAALVARRLLEQAVSPLLLAAVEEAAPSEPMEAPARRLLSMDSLRLVVDPARADFEPASMVGAVAARPATRPLPAVPAVRAAMEAPTFQVGLVAAVAVLVVTAQTTPPRPAVSERVVSVAVVAVATDKVVLSAQQVRVVAPAETTMSALPAQRVQVVEAAVPARRTQQILLAVPAGVDMFN